MSTNQEPIMLARDARKLTEDNRDREMLAQIKTHVDTAISNGEYWCRIPAHKCMSQKVTEILRFRGYDVSGGLFTLGLSPANDYTIKW